MPQKTTSSPPPRMTGAKATPILVVAGIFDLVRAACTLLWFLGPALLALYCTTKLSTTLSTWTFGALGPETATAACAAGATAIGAYGFAITAPLGIILAMAVGLMGWMTIGFWITLANRRLVTEDPTATAWMLGSLLISEVPAVDALPTLTATVWKLYRAQIKRDETAYRAWEREQARLQAEQAARIRAVQTAAANEARYEIPQEMNMAA